MLRVIACVGGGLMWAAAHGAPAEVQRTPELDLKTVQVLESRMADAFVRKDLRYLSALTAEDVVHIGGDGKIMRKTAYLYEVGKHRTYTAYLNANMKTRVFGDVAVVSGVEKVAGTFGGWEGTVVFFTTRVWAFRENAWRVVLWQATNLPGDAEPHSLEKLLHGK